MEVTSSSHMNVEKKIFNPHGRVCSPIVWLDGYGFKHFWELVLHHLISEAHWVSGAPYSGYILLNFGVHPGLVLIPNSNVSVEPCLVSVSVIKRITS